MKIWTKIPREIEEQGQIRAYQLCDLKPSANLPGFRFLLTWHPLFRRVTRMNGNGTGDESESFGE